jgi:kynurenine formamidase
MGYRLVDLSIPLQNAPMEGNTVAIHYIGHRERARMRAKSYGFPDTSYFPDGLHCANESITLISTHSGTHLDAPYHYGPTSEGKPARTIDEVPLEWCYGDGVVLDFHDASRGHNISVQEIQASAGRLAEKGYRLKPMDIVLIRTDHTTRYLHTTDFEQTHPGMSVEATEWLVDQGIKVMGIDAYSFDMPSRKMAELRREGNSKDFFGSHYLARRKEYVHAEKLCNLDQLPEFGFTVCMFPIKIERASGAWVRAVAIVSGY